LRRAEDTPAHEFALTATDGFGASEARATPEKPPSTSMSEQRNFYHVGYGKAGSSTLQHAFFPSNPAIHFYGIQYLDDMTPHWPFEEAGRLCGQIVHPEFFSGFQPTDVAHIEEQKAYAAATGKAFVFSNDHFSLLVAPQWSIGKMKELMPDAGIILVLRRQQDILKSIYKYRGKGLIYVPARFETRFVSFDEYFELALKNFRNRGGHKARDWVTDYFRIINFNRLAGYYADAFGQENVHILFFEDLAKRPTVFYRELSSVLGVPFDEQASYVLENRAMNVSPGPAEINYLKWKSRVLGNFAVTERFPWLRNASKKFHGMLRTIKAADVAFSDKQMEVLRSIYAEENRKLADRFGVDVKSRGYLV
jgi:hypothetical protein